MTDQYVVEMYSRASGTTLQRSIPKGKEAADRLAADIEEGLGSEILAVRVVPFVQEAHAPLVKARPEVDEDTTKTGYRSHIE